jgi:undecaprenyl-diphosphatase
MIVISGLSKRKDGVRAGTGDGKYGHPFVNSIVTGLVQGLALPFRGFSRSGSTISAAMLLGMQRSFSEDFSFALAVVLTPPAILREYLRLRHSAVSAGGLPYLQGMIGMALSFLAGIIAIRWLTAWLEKGRWHFFGFYCLVLSCVILALSFMKILN